ncbi:hypothetical protein [Thermocoleostomius sinensis]|uniref:Uncharacterized protein n=1 Tax=Thermocoleostomius sinensis A174 TaxID=2016057 RepID=A0A9E8ZIY6_9CYAN|nr:hypothetical protein [Thermocoleostomius sinensis]WAL62607.1 hypothetical protein OXH18_11625 [Thermocoleostomius sinensis A174]
MLVINFKFKRYLFLALFAGLLALVPTLAQCTDLPSSDLPSVAPLPHPAIATSTNLAPPTTRDPWLWPFSQDSIWNMPIGSHAQYKPANLPPAERMRPDFDLLFVIPEGSPLRALYNPGSWHQRCLGTTTYEHLSIPIPDDLIVPDAINTSTRLYTPNNAAALLQPDGRTLIQLAPMARCVRGGPVYGYRLKDNVDIYSQGIEGSHYGSGLSAIGGAIRKGELLGDAPIRHALKLELWEKYLHYDPTSPTPGYRWPATRADGQAAEIYEGTDPDLVMGALLAIPPQISEASLNLQTPAGRKLFHALQDYGGYHVDVTGWNCYGIAIEKGAEEEFKQAYGYDFLADTQTNLPFYEDLMKLFQSLSIVINNAPDNVGGGGTLRTSLAPPFRNEIPETS